MRQALISDLETVCDLSQEFANEAGWMNITSYVPEKARDHWNYILSTPSDQTSAVALLAEDLSTGEVVGGIKFYLQYSMTQDPIGCLDFIYVRQPYRMSGAGRALFSSAVAVLKTIGCCMFHASPGAMMKEDKSMANMLRKLGFEYETVSLVKILKKDGVDQ